MADIRRRALMECLANMAALEAKFSQRMNHA